MIILCPHCGAQPFRLPAGVLGTNEVRCHDCGLAVDAPAGNLVAGGAERSYTLDELPPEDRVRMRHCVVDEAIPSRWEPGLVLVVPEDAASVVEDIIASISSGRGHDDDDDGEASPEEEGQESMGQLFVAADRLTHTPWDAELVEDVDRLARAMARISPPYGVDVAIWRHIGSMAAALVHADESGPDDVLDAAQELRTFLRAYV